jgi:hypothetical protein
VWDLEDSGVAMVEHGGSGSRKSGRTPKDVSRTRGRVGLSSALLLLQALSACGTAGRGPSGTVSEGSAGRAGTGGTSAALDPGRTEMHRLNTAEYNATVEDVLGTTLQPANGNWRGGELGGFDNMASVLGVDEAQYERYFNAAKALATEVFASDELRARFVSCELSDAGCVRASLEAAGLRLFRRPLAADELATYQRVYDAALELGDTPLAALELAFQSLLSSAEFIYRIELDPQPHSAEAHPLSSFELASRLSYFLWSSAPDETLLRAAADDSLTQPPVLAATVDRMLEDARSKRFVTQFAGQWLGARRVVSHAVVPSLYDWNPLVARAASDEILLYFDDFLRSERSWSEFPVADVNYVDSTLAYFYGMPTPSVDGPMRVTFKEDHRAGFLGLAGFLALSSFDRRTSPSLRGRWILSNLLCAELPDPPPNVPKLEDEGDPSPLNVPEILERHRRNPECAACHALFDPYGLALEEYDAIGRYRTTYTDGTAVDASTVLPASGAHPEGLSLTGLDGLSGALASDPRLGECLGEKLFTYALGRLVSASDEPYLQQAQREWHGDGQPPTIHRLINLLVSTEPFRLRRGEGERSQP